MTEDELGGRLAATAEAAVQRLAAALGAAPLAGETARPARLLAAMRHGVLGGGKRLRPALVVETARLFGRDIDDGHGDILLAAAALECVHCYSLVHDDLPAMDDDDIRRGQPTVHRAFDEATAILAGDALLTLAFDLLADPAGEPDAAIRIRLVTRLARAAGMGGMVGGQMLDLAAEGRFDAPAAPMGEAEVRSLQAMKTGALLRFAVDAGAMLGRASGADAAWLARYGDLVGLAFQLADDLLDATADAATVGKATGKDAGRGKATLVALHGVEAARRRLDDLVAEAEAVLQPFGERADALVAIARFIAARPS
ncbi:polyprenyl synthetase family protein [Methylobrevis albus]|uniref:Probable farnesyl diphosphate synthase n=1 Tax=Methylobrevis albus TaxID=2793297 RepID=A0A931MZG2_9HYPH|nr:farnesyl diphosphate synthase [Methylobrevis albus]MBH0238029.1 polyprenyl synthetase family protein [Methylobrevis albus]